MKSKQLQNETLNTILISFLFTACLCLYAVCGISLFLDSLKPDTSYETLQEGIAEEVLRLHIIADSNSDEDQIVKLQVKDEIITYLHPYLASATNKAEAIDCIKAQLPMLTHIADTVLADNGFCYTSTAAIERCSFPIKTYGDITLPAGEYDALRIQLGTASGKNWWCLVFPKLCFTDVTHGTLPKESKEALKEVLTDDEYDAIIHISKKPKYRFRLWELLQEWWKN